MKKKISKDWNNANKEEDLNIIEESFNGLDKLRPSSNNKKIKNNNSSQNTNSKRK